MEHGFGEFKPLHLRGGRFDGSSGGRVGFPLEVIDELARYERLLIRVARELWKREHPERVRAPKGFEERLRLRLTTVDEGSVAPVLAPQRIGDDVLFVDEPWLERSQETIADALDAIVTGRPLPDSFPAAAIPTLVPFGSSLRPEEACDVVREGREPVVYTQTDRRRLERIVSTDDIKIDGQLVGRISGFEAEQRSFSFLDRQGNRADGAFEQIAMIDELRRYADRWVVAPFVRLDCRYSTDERGRLSKIEDVEDIEEVLGRNDALGGQLRPLLELTDGWDGTQARAPALSAIEWVRDFASELGEDELGAMVVVPTHEGGVLVERPAEGGRWSLEVERDGQASVIRVHAAGDAILVEVDAPEDAVAHLRAGR